MNWRAQFQPVKTTRELISDRAIIRWLVWAAITAALLL